MLLLEKIRKEAQDAALDLCLAASLTSGEIVVVGCSTSEIAGLHVGSGGNPELGAVVFDALYRVFSEKGIYLAAQCCEHLNRAIVIEREAVSGYEQVNAMPIPEAGGSFAAAAYKMFKEPIVIEEIYADAGLDIGNTLIGMHLKKVAVPLRLETGRIGQAPVTAAKTRPKLIGGVRAVYNERLM